MMPKLLAVTSPVTRRSLLEEGEEAGWRKERQKKVMLIKSSYAIDTKDNSSRVYSGLVTGMNIVPSYFFFFV